MDRTDEGVRYRLCVTDTARTRSSLFVSGMTKTVAELPERMIFRFMWFQLVRLLQHTRQAQCVVYAAGRAAEKKANARKPYCSSQ